ncbi:MAG: Verru_Chthon cassette protein B [Verrucomicrobiota bacterium]
MALPKRFQPNRDAFSLAEVTLALALVTVALIPVASLIILGVETMRESIEETAVARILESISGDLRMSNFADLSQIDNSKRFFDQEGTDVTGLPEASNAIYTARIIVSNTPSDVDLPGGLGRVTPQELKRIIVEVAVSRGNSFDFNSPSATVKRFPLYLPRYEARARS